MADSYFGFDTSATFQDLEPVEVPDLEEEYDALNDETFGSEALQGDWEEGHNKFVRGREHPRDYHDSFNSEHDDEDSDFESYLPHLTLDNLLLDDVAKNREKRTLTVEELERDLLRQRTAVTSTSNDLQNNFNRPSGHIQNATNQPYLINQRNKRGYVQPPPVAKVSPAPPRQKQGRGPFPMPPPMQDMMYGSGNQNLGPMTMVIPPHVLPPAIVTHPHPFIMGPSPNILRILPPRQFMIPPIDQPREKQHSNHFYSQTPHEQNRNEGNIHIHQPTRHFYSNHHPHNQSRNIGETDEYAGLMNNRERQWLLNIQILQLATTQPHVDDYYFTKWNEKQVALRKRKEEHDNKFDNERSHDYRKQKRHSEPSEPFFSNNRQNYDNQSSRERKDSDRDMTPNPSLRVYVPLQFENSLGKLQCGSVTAPRKIIDMDIVSEPHGDLVPTSNHRDSRKTKYILLELEKAYLDMIALEEIDSTIDNLTPQQNSNLVQDQTALEGTDITEVKPTKSEYIDRLMTSLLNDEKFLNFICIRKGKVLLLRLFQQIDGEYYQKQFEVWVHIIKSFPVIVKKDQNDGLLIRFYPFFKKWVSSAIYSDIFLLLSVLLSKNNQLVSKSSVRASSPSSGRNLLPYILSHKLGISMICCMFTQVEQLSSSFEEKATLDWSTFITNFVHQMAIIPNTENLPSPVTPVTHNTIGIMLKRCKGLRIHHYDLFARVLSPGKENS